VTLADYWGLIRTNRNFRLLWLAQIVSELGDWLYAVVIYSLLLERTGTAMAVASAVVLQVLPQVITSPMAGVINDRLRRRSVMIFADLVRVVIVLGMLLAIRQDVIWPIYILLLFETVMWGLFEPGRSALLPNLTRDGRETLVANTLSSTTWSFNLAIGSTLGGLLAVWLGRDVAFLINAISFVVSALLLARIKVEEPHAEGHPPLAFHDLFNFTPVLEGFRYIRRDRRLAATILAKAGLGIMGANYVVLSIYGERIFPIGSSAMLGMSVLLGARGLGAILGPVIGSYWAGGERARLRRGIAYGFLMGAAGYLFLSQAPNLWTAVACVTVAHSGGSIIWVFSTALLQGLAEDRFRGRVFSADYASNIIALTASVQAAGLAVDAGSPVRIVAAGVGVALLIPALLFSRRHVISS